MAAAASSPFPDLPSISMDELKVLIDGGRCNAVLGYLLYTPVPAKPEERWTVRGVDRVTDIPPEVTCDAHIPPKVRGRAHQLRDVDTDVTFNAYIVARVDCTMDLEEAMLVAEATIISDYESYKNSTQVKPSSAFKWALNNYTADAMYRGWDYPRKGRDFVPLTDVSWESQDIIARQESRMSQLIGESSEVVDITTPPPARRALFADGGRASHAPGATDSIPMTPSILAGGRTARKSPRLKKKKGDAADAGRASDKDQTSGAASTSSAGGAAAGASSGGGADGGGGGGGKRPPSRGHSPTATSAAEANTEETNEDDEEEEGPPVASSQGGRGTKRPHSSPGTPGKKESKSKIDRNFLCDPPEDCDCNTKTHKQMFRDLSKSGPEAHMGQLQEGLNWQSLNAKVDAIGRTLKDVVEQLRVIRKRQDENIDYAKASAAQKTVEGQFHNDKLLLGVPFSKMEQLEDVEGDKEKEDAVQSIIKSVGTSQLHCMRDICAVFFTDELRKRTYATCPKRHYTKTGIYMFGVKYAVLPGFFYQMVKCHLEEQFKLSDTDARHRMNNFFNMRRKESKAEDEWIFLRAQNRTKPFFEMLWCNTKANVNVIDEEAPLRGSNEEQAAFLAKWNDKVNSGFEDLKQEERNKYKHLYELDA